MKKLLFLAFALLLSSQPAVASDASGKIFEVHVMPNGVILFSLDSGARSGVPACALDSARWAFDGTTPAGQARLSLLLTAYASGKIISVFGTGACSSWLDTESVNYLKTSP